MELSLEFKEIRQARAEIFLSNGFISKISIAPTRLLDFFLLPIFLMAYTILLPLMILGLNSVNSKLLNIESLLKKKIGRASYPDIKSIERDFKKIVEVLPELGELPDSFFLRPISKRLLEFKSRLESIQQILDSVLYVSISNQPPLSEKEKKAFEWLGDVWGEDTNDSYGEFTHSVLTQNPQ